MNKRRRGGSKPVVTDVARSLLVRRLQAVYRFLPLAAWFSELDVEHVHQLRVSCRQAEATLDVLTSVLPRRLHRQWRSRLRRIRRDAGAARDIDVMLGRLESRGRSRPQDEVDAIRWELRAKRQSVQAALIQAAERERLGEFPLALRRLCDAVAWRGGQPEPSWIQHSQAIGTALQQKLRRQAAKLAVLDAQATLDVKRYQAMHRLRIIGKQMRYALALFRRSGGWQPAKSLREQLESLQMRLGEINDHVTTDKQLSKMIGKRRYAKGRRYLERWRRDESALARRKVLAFHRWWQSAQERLIDTSSNSRD